MKKTFFSLTLAALVLISCNSAKKENAENGTTPVEYADSTQYAVLKMSAELPDGNDNVSQIIRDTLCKVIKDQISSVDELTADGTIEEYKGKSSDAGAFVKFYGEQAFRNLSANSEKISKERMAMMKADSSIKPDDKADMKEAVMQWTYDMSIKKIESSDRYAVYLSRNYEFLGGAHGIVSGRGPLIFDLSTGALADNLLQADAAEKMQPLLRKGLVSYYSADNKQFTEEDLKSHLQVKGDIIPLPSYTAYPSKDGLVFTYTEYEIAPYSDGMPTFTLPYSDVKPFLTDAAKKLLNME